MKRVFLARVSLLALIAGRSALAAPPNVPAPYFSWTGCYVGGNVGGGWGSKELTDVPPNGMLMGWLSENISGFLGGGQIGCNYQFAKNWVIGLEGDLSGADIRGNASGAFGLTTTTFSAQTAVISTVVARFGYSWDRWLMYVKGGAAWAADEYQATNSYWGSYNAAETRSGWTLGAGLEWAFADHWSARLEYNLYDFGSRTLQFVYVPGTGTPAGGGALPVSPENVNQQIQALTVGLNYRF